MSKKSEAGCTDEAPLLANVSTQRAFGGNLQEHQYSELATDFVHSDGEQDAKNQDNDLKAIGETSLVCCINPCPIQ